MLKYGDNKNKKTGSIITKIGNIVDFEQARKVVQPLIKTPLESLLKKKDLVFKNNIFYVNGLVDFQADKNKFFIWPEEYPLYFSSPIDGKLYAKVPITAQYIDLQNWHMPACDVLYGLNLLYFYSGVQTLNVSGWNTSSCKKLKDTFKQFIGIEHLDLSTWDLTNVETIDSAFESMEYLKTITFNEKGLPSLVNTKRMFFSAGRNGCSFDLRGVKTGTITNAEEMIAYSNFTEIDLRGWKFASDCNFRNFARGCNNLQIFNGVKLKNEWIEKKKLSKMSNDIYIDCTNVCVDIIKNPEKYEQYLVK